MHLAPDRMRLTESGQLLLFSRPCLTECDTNRPVSFNTRLCQMTLSFNQAESYKHQNASRY